MTLHAGETFAGEIPVIEWVLREYGGTIPDEQLIEEAGLAWRSSGGAGDRAARKSSDRSVSLA